MGNGWLLLVVCVLSLSGAAAAPKDAVATLAGAKGGVEVRPRGSGSWARVQGSKALAEGTAVRVSGGGRAVIYQPGCPPRVLKEGDALVVSAGKRWLTGTTSQRVTPAQHRSLLQLLARSARSYRSAPTGVRPGERETEIALSPRAEQVLDGRPTFVWRDGGEGSQYELELYRGERVVWEAKTSEPRLPYPTHRPTLRPGRYQWQVYVTTSSGRQEADGARFTVPDAPIARRIRAEVAAARSLMTGESVNLPLLSLQVTHRLYTPAEAALQQALLQRPADPELRRLLAHVRALQGRSGPPAEMLPAAGPR
jgi:hypothetical protein